MLNKKLFRRGEVVAVAFSGGKDSACLFDMLLKNKSSLGITLKAVNVEHGIRGETSVRDSEFVRAVCEREGVPLKTYKLDCKAFSAAHGYSVEEGARIARYECFKDAIQSGFCDKVATAHHLSDGVETVLFNLFRGASVSGVTGISEVALNGKIIRPLSGVSRAEIDAYAYENSIAFVTDETNLDSEYSRNFIRNEVLPLIRKRFPEVEKSVGRFAEISERENEYLDLLATAALGYERGAYLLAADLPDCVFARATVIALKKLGVGKDYEKTHVDAVLALKTAESGSGVDLPKGLRAVREYDNIAVYAVSAFDIAEREVPFKTGDIDGFGKALYFGRQVPEKPKCKILKFDGDKLPFGAVIRYRKGGDEFKKFGGGRKKLNDYFTDIKVPKRLRDGIPLVCLGSEVYLICGIEISDLIKVDKDTKNVLQCMYVDNYGD